MTHLASDLDTSPILRLLLNTPDTARVDHSELDGTSRWAGVQEQYASLCCRGRWSGRRLLFWRLLDLEILYVWSAILAFWFTLLASVFRRLLLWRGGCGNITDTPSGGLECVSRLGWCRGRGCCSRGRRCGCGVRVECEARRLCR